MAILDTTAYGGSNLGTPLQQLLLADHIEPGADISYTLCRNIRLYHPLGAKMADGPVRIAQSQDRQIVVPGAPEEHVVGTYRECWRAMGVDAIIANLVGTTRCYGRAAVVAVAEGFAPDQPLDDKAVDRYGDKLRFNVVDPLQLASSGSGGLDPNRVDYQRPAVVTVQGTSYHPTRVCTLVHEDAVYLAFTGSSFAYTGRSVYQRALYPMKSYVQSMITDDLVTRKAGVIVAKIKQQMSATDRLAQAGAAFKRFLLREAQTDNVISIGADDEISTLDVQGVGAVHDSARAHILMNCAVASDMPAQLLNSETYVSGFGEGTEDAKKVAAYIDSERIRMDPAYRWFDRIVQRVAWTPALYEVVQSTDDEFEDVTYQTAYYRWVGAFRATWPSLLTEPDSKKSDVERVKLETIVKVFDALKVALDPDNVVRLVDWVTSNLNEQKLLFPTPLDLDPDTLLDWLVSNAAQAQETELGAEEEGAGGKPPQLRAA